MKIAIYGKPFNKESTNHINNLFLTIAKLNIRILIHHTFYECVLPIINNIPIDCEVFKHHFELTEKVDFVVSIGGDGTFLECVSLVRDKDIPIIGINTGRMGFLADISLSDAPKAIEALIHRDFQIENRTLIQLVSAQPIFNDFNFALNELTIHKKDSASMMMIKAYINGQYLNTYWADGLIVSTPTGSTAYSLSSGGPIVVPDARNFIITPLAPHNLTIRPIVVPDDNEITLKMEGRSSNFLVSLDSRSETIDTNVELKIKKADFNVKLLKLSTYSYFNTLRSKLMWGLDMRN